MGMATKAEAWQASDGKFFGTEVEADDHEEGCKKQIAVKRMIREISNLLQIHSNSMFVASVVRNRGEVVTILMDDD